MDFTIVERAGLRMSDLAIIVGVTRGRVSQWKLVPPLSTSPRYQMLVDALRIMDKAVSAGKLPLPKMDRSNRARVVEKIKAKLTT